MASDVINDLNQKADPPIGGYVITSMGDGSKGTYGLLVGITDDQQSHWCFLTAYHMVSSDSGICAVSQPDTDRKNIITQYDSSYTVCDPRNGKYLIFSDLKLDVAACVVEADARKWRSASQIYSPGGPRNLRSARLPSINTVVYKVGRSTGITSGRVLGASGGKLLVDGSFCDNGDSGAPVYDQLGNWCGIVTSGQSGKYGVFADAFSIMNSMYGKGLKLQLLGT